MDKPCGKDRPAIPLPSTHFQARPSTATANQKPKTMVASLRTGEVAKIKIVHPININIYINININIKIKLEIKIVKYVDFFKIKSSLTNIKFLNTFL